MIEHEINELTVRISATPGERIQSIFLPNCRIEDLPHEIAKHRPDVLHIAAHGDERYLYLADASGEPISITAEMLANFLPAESPPQLIYLNACETAETANYLKKYVPMVIGAPTPISNLSARAAAGVFYARVSEGNTVQQAFDAAKSLGQALHREGEWVLAKNADTDSGVRLCESFQLVARFYELRPTKAGVYEFEVGVIGCPSATQQVVLFTDEWAFNINAEEEDESEMAYELAMVGRHNVHRSTMWFHQTWGSESDFRVYAVAITPDGKMLTTTDMLCRAVERYYLLSNWRNESVDPRDVTHHLRLVRGWDGVPVEGGDRATRVRSKSYSAKARPPSSRVLPPLSRAMASAQGKKPKPKKGRAMKK
jgi:hypothetical protein